MIKIVIAGAIRQHITEDLLQSSRSVRWLFRHGAILPY
jgi:hypothetical protein